ncbi:20687_t:CDS:1, partial [Racocetra persica]
QNNLLIHSNSYLNKFQYDSTNFGPLNLSTQHNNILTNKRNM